MGGDHGHGDHHGPAVPKLPDWKMYKVENSPTLVAHRKKLADLGLKDPWMRVIHYGPTEYRMQNGKWCLKIEEDRSSYCLYVGHYLLIIITNYYVDFFVPLNEVWRYQYYDKYSRWQVLYKMGGRGMKWGFLAAVITTGVGYMMGDDHGHGDGHGDAHGHGH